MVFQPITFLTQDMSVGGGGAVAANFFGPMGTYYVNLALNILFVMLLIFVTG